VNRKSAACFLVVICLQTGPAVSLPAAPPPAPVITNLNLNGPQRNLRFAPYPAAAAYTILGTTNLALPLAADTNFALAPYVAGLSSNGTNFGYEWRATNAAGPAHYYRVAVTPLASNAVLAATAYNRLAYGPTPDDLDWLTNHTPDDFITNQLAPWNLLEDVDGSHTNFPTLNARLVDPTNFVWPTNANIADFRAWHILRAVNARRQLLEVLLQFLENHFVTQWSKSQSYFDGLGYPGDYGDRVAAQLEYHENLLWRNALLNPQCTFYDLLKISAESPAMIIYLDTVASRGDGSNVANENYARELLELFTMGVNNGYDQTDVTTESRLWTGWRLEKVDFTNVFNPFAGRTTAIYPGSTNTSTTLYTNLYGAWAFNYKTNYHNATTKAIFTNKFVPARFGPPWTTRTYGTNPVPGLYQVVIPGHATTDTNGISEGYQFLQHIANLPFTEEYVCIKLCRLFVSDNFPNPSDDPTDPAYPAYNYAAGNLSPEADLVHQCMLTWETNSPQGQLWPVLQTIFNSDLFRTGSASQKVKTPLEHTVSIVRALRSSTNGTYLAGSFTAFTDGYGIGGSSSGAASPLQRMGDMLLFDRSSPDGYPETAPGWVSAGTLAERIRFAQSFCLAGGQSGHSGSQTGTGDDASGSFCDITTLVKTKLPPASWTNAPALVDYFLGLFYPGEGAGNLQLYRQAAINALNNGSADSPPSSTPFAGLAVSGTAGSAYDTRLRSMVGLLLSMQRFQEQ
jgi:uncharacterized protein (DUF1800 family)